MASHQIPKSFDQMTMMISQEVGRMSFDFTIPLAQKDLLTRSEVNQYVVEEVTPIRLVPVKLQVCTTAFRTQGPLFVLECFDFLYSCLRHADNINMDIKEDAWQVILKATLSHANGLVEILELTDLDTKTRRNHLNAVKMTSYLLCQFVDVFEADVMRQATAVAHTAKGRKKDRRQTMADMGHLDWEVERQNAVRALLQLVQLNIHRLWQPPVIEEEFINLVTGSCYRLLENPNAVKTKGTRDYIFHLIGLMIKKYNHGLGCRLKLLQLLQHFEHLASPLAQAVHTFALEFGATTMVSEMMREIGSIDTQDLARDTSGTRAYSVFLMELAERIPALMLPNMCVLATLLDEEPYTMRNCVLSIMGEMVVHLLSQDIVGEKEKATRDQFLDRLEDHIHDVNAFVRSKTLQIWMTIVNEKMLPLPRQHRLLELVIGRLQDRSSQVRKNAIQLVTALLSTNPFAAKLPLEELRASYDTEKAKLDEMMPTMPDTPLKGKLDEMMPTMPDTPLKGKLDEMMPTLPDTPLKGKLDEMMPTLPDTPLKGKLDEMMLTLPDTPLKDKSDEMMPTLPDTPLKGKLDEMMPTLPDTTEG
ncbi:Condensin complex subunit 1 [Lamellibrachia satsuma]|nr:Condensin complex subunit 1 [Lamellibrachia satsuma]